MKKVRRDDPRFGDALHHLSTATTLMEALDNPKLIRNGLSNEGVRLVCERLAGELQRSAEMTLGEEISSLFGDRPSDRGVMLRLGLSGLEPMTLQEAGERVGVTRERVRQKQEQLFTMFERTKPYLPALDRGLKAVEESLSNNVDSIQAMEQRLRVAGILGERDTLSQLIEFAALNRNRCYQIVSEPPFSIVVRDGESERVASALSCVRRTAVERTRDFGACSIDAISHALEDKGLEEWAPRVSLLISALGDIEWLEDGTWFRVRRKWNAIANQSRKILSISPSIRIGELRKGLMRSHRISQVPPKNVLGKLLVSELPDLGLQFDSEILTATRTERPEDVLSPTELALYEVLRENGGVMSRAELERAVRGRINLSSFYVILMYYPIIEQHSRGVYGLRGVAVRTGVVEALAPKSWGRQRTSRDFGHLEDGRVWLVQCLTQPAVDHGTITCPSALKPYVAAEYAISVGDVLTRYEVCVSSGQVRFKRGFLQGVEAGDYVLLIFNNKSRTVEITFGDQDVVEKMQAPRGTSDTVDSDLPREESDHEKARSYDSGAV